MLKNYYFLIKSKGRLVKYLFLSFLISLSLILSSAKIAYSNSLFDVLLQGVQVIRLSTISEQDEVQLGKQINRSLIKQGQIRILRQRELNGYINEIGSRLAEASERPSMPYTFQIVQDDNVNAFATMGGFVYVNTGLLTLANNEAELASVMAHEIGHISARHSLKQMRQKALTQGLLSAAGIDNNAAIQIGVELAISRPNSREDELEADRLGLENLERARYAPIAMVEFMKKLLKVSANVPEFLSSHPATSERITALEKMIDPNTESVGDGLNNKSYQRFIRQWL